MAKHVALLLNLGSPNSTSVSDIRKYLAEFLMDKYVIDAPAPIRFGIVYGAILPKRPKNTAKAYQKIWTDKGSPLVAISKETQEKLQAITDTPIYLAMRYGNPSIKSVLKTIKQDNPDLERITAVPMYPQYAMSTTQTVMEKVTHIGFDLKLNCTLTFIQPFYNHPDYIRSLVDSAKPHIDNASYILFSYHGLPERHLRKTDPTGSHCLTKNCCSTPSPAHNTCYKYQCVETTKQFMAALGKDIPHSIAFQSRLGKDPWLTPSTDDELKRLAKAGIKNIHVICPSFTTDCLETLEEINMEGREEFLENGGDTFTYIPCLNTHESWIQTLKNWII